MLWTSVATGMTADRHGVLGFVEPEESGFGVRLVRQGSRRVRAVWEMLGERGLRSVVIGWPVTGPAEDMGGVMVSDRALDTLRDRPEEVGELEAGLVSPDEMRGAVGEWRHHPCDFSPWDLREMIPAIGEIDLGVDGRPADLARALARCVTVHNVATGLVGGDDWDFFAVYYDMIDRAGHEFMSYRAPRMEGVSDEDFRRYGGVMDEVYVFHDAMLGRLLELAGPDVGVLLLSDHGFQTGSRRPRYRGPSAGGVGIAEDGADWHRMHGVLLMHGPGIRAGERVFGATLLDMAPTMLGYFGLPAGEDMPGRVLESALVDGRSVPRIASWEATGPRVVGGGVGELPRPLEEAAVRDLVALGYLASGVEAGAAAARRARREQDFNLGVVYLSTARPGEAVAVFRGLVGEDGGEVRYRLGEIEALAAEGRHREVLAAVVAFGETGVENAFVEMAAAAAHFALGDAGMSGRCLERAQRLAGNHPDVLHLVGQMHLERGRYWLAREAFAEVVAMDPLHFHGMTGLAESFLELRQYEVALEKVVGSLRMAYWNPRSHLVLGRILLETGGYDDAVRAFRLALAQAPRWVSAHQFLAEALGRMGDPAGARRHRALAAECASGGSSEGERVTGDADGGGARDTVTMAGEGGEILVVTGLPRSGTSMMMQMLMAGGKEVLTDRKRGADEHNEGGYYEWELVKQLPVDPGIIGEARGRAVKVVAALLPSLPMGWRYAVICMRRDGEEVEASQLSMLGRDGAESSVAGQLAQFEASLAWLRGVSGVRMLEVPFRELLERSADLAQEIASFAGLPGERAEAMAAVVRREWSRHSR
jgi:tetratricopeptide (TPR) repeat protein